MSHDLMTNYDACPTSSGTRYRGLQVGCQVANAKYSGHSCDRPIR